MERNDNDGTKESATSSKVKKKKKENEKKILYKFIKCFQILTMHALRDINKKVLDSLFLIAPSGPRCLQKSPYISLGKARSPCLCSWRRK